jgi:hypothetical protein
VLDAAVEGGFFTLAIEKEKIVEPDTAALRVIVASILLEFSVHDIDIIPVIAVQLGVLGIVT